LELSPLPAAQISQPSPETEPSLRQVIVDEELKLTPRGHDAPS
jgi:hypothetical protein